MAASLLTRISHAADPNSTERHTWRDHDIESAILRNLLGMLNTRQGSCLSAPEYGIVELSEMVHDFPDAIGIMQRSLKASIAQYEPRLKNVQVRHLKNEQTHSLTLEFEITAQIQLPDGRKQAMRLGAAVDQSGNVSLT